MGREPIRRAARHEGLQGVRGRRGHREAPLATHARAGPRRDALRSRGRGTPAGSAAGAEPHGRREGRARAETKGGLMLRWLADRLWCSWRLDRYNMQPRCPLPFGIELIDDDPHRVEVRRWM